MKINIAKNELDFTQKSTLDSDFWKDDKLNPEVRKAILAVVKNFIKSTNLDVLVEQIDEIELTGSLANYNYSKFSDVDVHLLFDFSKFSKDPDFLKDYLTTKAINWNNRHNVTIFGHEVELYVTDAGSEHYSTGVYSVKNNDWIVKPVRDPKLSAELNLNKVIDKADKVSKQIDMIASIDNPTYEEVEDLKNKIKKMREAGLETGGEFSIENLAFKLLRRRGELNTLYTLMNQAQDAELSLDEDVEWWKKRRELDNKNYRELIGHVRGAKKNKKGPPYMMEPPSKLPKSAAPGVGALEEETKTIQRKLRLPSSTPLNKLFDDYLSKDIPVTVNFRADSEGCLNDHSYVIAGDFGGYLVNLVGDLKQIVKPSSPIEDPKKCLYIQVGRKNSEFSVSGMLNDAIKAGKIKNYEVTVTETVEDKPLRLPINVPSTFQTTTTVSSLTKRIKAEKKTITLALYPKKDMFFLNLAKFEFPKFESVTDIVSLDYIKKLFAATKKLFVENLLFYKKGSKILVKLDKRNNQVSSTRDLPVGGILNEIKEQIITMVLEELKKNLPEVPDFLGGRAGILEKINERLQKSLDVAAFLRTTKLGILKNFSTIEDYLSDLDEESNGDPCTAFDCKKSTIIKQWTTDNIEYVTYDEKRGPRVGQATLKDYLGITDSKYEAPETKIEGTLEEFLTTIKQDIRSSRRKRENPTTVDGDIKKGPAPFFALRLDEGTLNALLWMKQQMIADKVPGAQNFGVKSAYRSDQKQARLYSAFLNSKKYEGTFFKKKYCEAGSTKIFKDARKFVAPPNGTVEFTVDCKPFDKEDIVATIEGKGSSHRTGRAVDFNFSALSSSDESLARDRANPIFKWLQTNAGKFGFIPYPPEPWHWEMSLSGSEEWKKFGKPSDTDTTTSN